MNMKKDIYTPHGLIETYIDGEGTPILFIHGTGGNAMSNWSELIRTLRSKTDWLYIRPNLPGSGRTPNSKEDLNLKIINAQIISILNELKIEEVHVIGFSLGASIALYLAGTHPERFLSVTSIGGFINSEAPSMQLKLKLWQDIINIDYKMASQTLCLDIFGSTFLMKLGNKMLNELVKSIEIGTNWDGMLSQIKLDLTINITSALNSITQPVLILTGTEDQIIPYEYANQLYHRLPQSKLIQINTGHASVLERPVEVANLLVDFIKSQ
ncbi:MAG: alpha/beta fold hydrolase [Neisseriaceae bacterium]|nr:MAG: alpha/beta fold hydrolase [Neisseriaceae bacterium]